MRYWLVKSEPEEWSWEDHWSKPGRRARWDGVRNHQAANFMREMAKGDRVFFYHSGKSRRIVGVLEVVRGAYADPGDASGRFVAVDMKAVRGLPEPVTLAAVKAEGSLGSLALVRQSRLSVMPIPAEAWATICAMGGLKDE